MLNYICAPVPNDIKDDILEVRIKFRWKNSVKLCKLIYCNVSLLVAFGRFTGKSLQQKKKILVNLHSVISNNIKTELHHRCFLNYIVFLENSKLDILFYQQPNFFGQAFGCLN